MASMRLCIDYRMLNHLNIKNRHHLPRINNLFDKLSSTVIFLKVGLRSGYHQLRIKVEGILNTTIRTRYEHYEFLIISFGLINVPVQ